MEKTVSSDPILGCKTIISPVNNAQISMSFLLLFELILFLPLLALNISMQLRWIQGMFQKYNIMSIYQIGHVYGSALRQTFTNVFNFVPKLKVSNVEFDPLLVHMVSQIEKKKRHEDQSESRTV